MKEYSEVIPQPSLLQPEQTQLSQLVITGEVLQRPDHIYGLPLDTFEQVHVVLLLTAPELNSELYTDLRLTDDFIS